MLEHETRLIEIAGSSIEVKTIGTPVDAALPIVMLHDSLGSIEHWKEFPNLLAQNTGRQVFAYSREGSGRSSNFRKKRDINYLHDEAQKVLPELVENLQIEKAILFGHSDGASIALIFAACFPELCAAVIVSAPHIFVESITLEGIRKADATGREKIISMLERYHNDPKSLYLAWRDTWLLPEFRNWNIEEYVSKIKCPVLAIQGKQDEYGTPRQVERIGELVSASKIVLLDNCRHATYKDCEPEVMDEVLLFSRSIS